MPPLVALALLALWLPLSSANANRGHGQQAEGAPAAVDPPVRHVGGSVKPPVAISTPQPRFTDEARQEIKRTKKNFDESVRIYMWVEADGTVSHARVVKGVGLGLDEQALKAVRKYRFKPATMDGKPVVVDVFVEVRFQALY